MPARTAHPVACALLAALAGCAEEPSFQLGWRISTDPAVTDPDLAPRLCSVARCSEVGIEKVRLEIRGADDPVGTELRFVKEYGCFQSAFDAVFDECDQDPIGDGPLAGWIDGPTLPAGEYEVELIGLRRNGGEWPCTSEDEQGNETEIACARDQASLTIREGELPELAFSLAAPSQCDDGVDNDRDGRVDSSDPACTLGEPLESFDAGRTLFQLSVGILDNPLIEPTHVDIDAFALTIDGQPFETLEPNSGLDVLWPWRFRLLDEALDAGSHTLGLVALGPDGALTQPQTHDFEVDAEQGAFVIHQFDLASADFLAPIEDRLRVSWALGEPGEIGNPCQSHQLAIDEIRVKVGSGAQFLAEGELFVVEGMQLGPVVADWHSFSCVPTGEIASTTDLVWDDVKRTIEIEARSGGAVCFATPGPRDTRPSSTDPMRIFAARVLVDGQPPAGCEECVQAEDCGDLANLVCSDAGLCVPN